MSKGFANQPSRSDKEFVKNSKGEKVRNRAYIAPAKRNRHKKMMNDKINSFYASKPTTGTGGLDRAIDIIHKDDDTVRVETGKNNSWLFKGDNTGFRMEVIETPEGYTTTIFDKKNRIREAETSLDYEGVADAWDKTTTLEGNGYYVDDILKEYGEELREGVSEGAGVVGNPRGDDWASVYEGREDEFDNALEDNVLQALNDGDITDKLSDDDVDHIVMSTIDYVAGMDAMRHVKGWEY